MHNIDIKVGKLDITNLKCTSISLGNLSTTLDNLQPVAPTPPAPSSSTRTGSAVPQVTLSAIGLSVSCTADYAVTLGSKNVRDLIDWAQDWAEDDSGGGGPDIPLAVNSSDDGDEAARAKRSLLHGSLTIAIGDKPDSASSSHPTPSSVSLSLALHLNQTTGLAQSASSPHCSLDIYVNKLLHDGKPLKILGVDVGSLLEDLAHNQIAKKACAPLQQLVATNLTATLDAVNQVLLPYIVDPPPPIPPPLAGHQPSDAVSLTEPSAIMGLGSYVLNQVVGANGLLGVNEVVKELGAPNGSVLLTAADIGQFPEKLGLNITVPPVPTNVTVPLPDGLANVTLDLHSVGLAGLRSWTHFNPLEPLDNYTLGLHTAMERFDLVVEFGLTVDAGMVAGHLVQSPRPLYELARLTLRLADAELRAAIRLVLLHGPLSTFLMEPSQLTEPACLVRAAHLARLAQLSFGMRVDNVSLAALGAGGGGANDRAEQQLDAAINAVAQLFTSSFASAIPAFWNAFVAAPAVTAANTQLAASLDGLRHQQCPPPPPVPFDGHRFNTISTKWAAVSMGSLGLVIALSVCLASAVGARRRRRQLRDQVRQAQRAARRRDKKQRRRRNRRQRQQSDAAPLLADDEGGDEGLFLDGDDDSAFTGYEVPDSATAHNRQQSASATARRTERSLHTLVSSASGGDSSGSSNTSSSGNNTVTSSSGGSLVTDDSGNKTSMVRLGAPASLLPSAAAGQGRHSRTLSSALIAHPRVPLVLRALVPLVLLLNIGLFFSSNTSVGAGVFAAISAEDRTLTLQSLFNFSLANSVRDMWNAKVYALSLLVAVFSGAWPYTKLVLMLIGWCTPPMALSTGVREAMLMFLDALGKWSLLDAYVLTMMMVAFRFHIQMPDTLPLRPMPPPFTNGTTGSAAFLPNPFSSNGVRSHGNNNVSTTAASSFLAPEFNIFVEPVYGVYSFLIATVLSLLMTHVILAAHRHASKPRALLSAKDRRVALALARSATAATAATVLPADPLASVSDDDGEDDDDDNFLPQNNSKGYTAATIVVTAGDRQPSAVKEEKAPQSLSLSSAFTVPGGRSGLRDSAVPLRRTPFKCSGHLFSCLPGGQFAISVLLLATLPLVMIGALVSSFAFEFRGGAGFLLSFAGDSPTQTFSLFQLGEAIMKASNTEPAGLRFIQVSFFLYSVGVPLAHVLAMAALWLVPMKLQTQRVVYVVAEILQAWSAVDVFVVSLLAALLEISQFAQFIIGDKCNIIDVLLEKYFAPLLDGDYLCFDVVTTLHTGCWLLFCAAILYATAGVAVMRVCHRAIAAREQLEAADDLTVLTAALTACNGIGNGGRRGSQRQWRAQRRQLVRAAVSAARLELGSSYFEDKDVSDGVSPNLHSTDINGPPGGGVTRSLLAGRRSKSYAAAFAKTTQWHSEEEDLIESSSDSDQLSLSSDDSDFSPYSSDSEHHRQRQTRPGQRGSVANTTASSLTPPSQPPPPTSVSNLSSQDYDLLLAAATDAAYTAGSLVLVNRGGGVSSCSAMCCGSVSGLVCRRRHRPQPLVAMLSKKRSVIN